MTSTDTYQLKWHSHSSHLNGSVASLLRSERFTDVVLCTMDGSQIPAHKFILSSCSIYLSNLFDGQRSVMRMGNTMLYVVLPSEISTRALQILVEYMYKGETTVSNEVLDTVLKAGEVLKIRGLWRQTDVDNNGTTDATTVEKTVSSPNILNKQVVAPKKLDTVEATPKITVKKDEKLLKTFTPLQSQNISRPMFIGPPKLVFIKTSEGNTGLRPIAPKAGTQTIIMTPEISKALTMGAESDKSSMVTISTQVETKTSESEAPTRVLRKIEKKYGKKSKSDKSNDNDDSSTERGNEVESEKQNDEVCGTKLDGKATEPVSAPTSSSPKIFIKDEPEWNDPTEDDMPIAEMFHTEMNIKSENEESIDISDEQMYSPLTCELCAEVFSVPAEWVRHIQSHAGATAHTRKRKHRSASDDTEETTALLRCDLCQKHFPNPAEWVRHIQSTHTESEGVQNKTCSQCSKSFPSHASMVIHMRTHTGERPFICGLCNKGFNVKSNLLRHLRTLHDQIISPGQVLDQEEVSSGDEASTSAPERIKLES